MRLLHAGPRRRHGGAARAEPEPERGRDPRGAVRQPLPLHRLREDLRRRPAGGFRRARHDDDAGAAGATPARAGRRSRAPARRDAEGNGRVRVLERPERGRDALGRHRPQPPRAREARRARHLAGGADAGGPRGADARGRARAEDLRARVRRPARARRGPRPLLRRAGGARRRRGAGAGAPRRSRRSGRVRAARAGRGHGTGDRAASAPSRAADDGARLPRGRAPERRPPPRHPPRRPGGRRGRHRQRRLRARDPGSGVPRAGVRPRRARRRGRRGHLRRDAVAARRPRPGGAVPGPRAGDGADPPRRRRRRFRRPGGPLDADPRRAARAAHEAAREDRLQPRGVVLRPRSPASGADLVRAPGDDGRRARERADADPARRRRLRLQLDRGHLERCVLRDRAVQGGERAARVDVRLHEQPALRRDARLRRRPDVLRRRGADGQARGRARDRPGGAAAAERARQRRHAADGAGDRRCRCRRPR